MTGQTLTKMEIENLVLRQVLTRILEGKDTAIEKIEFPLIKIWTWRLRTKIGFLVKHIWSWSSWYDPKFRTNINIGVQLRWEFKKEKKWKVGKHAFDQESDQEKKKKAITVKKKRKNHALDQESKIQEKTITIKKKKEEMETVGRSVGRSVGWSVNHNILK